jgi:hypothetical protein
MLTEVKPNKEMSSDQTPTKNLYMQYIKRPLGFVLSLVALIVLSPVLLVIALLVRIKLGSPIIFKQERPGKDERPFTLYKFRTMSDERDKNGNLLPDNLRATSFGNMLRKTSLDELPELFNILNGDMSIVGPRPLMVEYLPFKQFSKWHHFSNSSNRHYSVINAPCHCSTRSRLAQTHSAKQRNRTIPIHNQLIHEMGHHNAQTLTRAIAMLLLRHSIGFHSRLHLVTSLRNHDYPGITFYPY